MFSVISQPTGAADGVNGAELLMKEMNAPVLPVYSIGESLMCL